MMTIKHEMIAEPDQEEALFVGFANTLEYTRGEPDEQLPDIDALLDWLRERGLISGRARAAEASRLRRDRDEAERRLERFRHLRDLLQAISHDLAERGEPDPDRVTDLNHILRHGLHYHQLRQQPGGTRYEVAQVGDRLDQARATIASSFAHFLAEDAPERLRICANDGCRYVFIDRSPTGRRRWCDMRTCGNQAKVAAHRARARAQTTRAEEAPGVPPAAASV
jgi:predicted RNA-binding Zn ribbon-like protein